MIENNQDKVPLKHWTRMGDSSHPNLISISSVPVLRATKNEKTCPDGNPT